MFFPGSGENRGNSKLISSLENHELGLFQISNLNAEVCFLHLSMTERHHRRKIAKNEGQDITAVSLLYYGVLAQCISYTTSCMSLARPSLRARKTFCNSRRPLERLSISAWKAIGFCSKDRRDEATATQASHKRPSDFAKHEALKEQFPTSVGTHVFH